VAVVVKRVRLIVPARRPVMIFTIGIITVRAFVRTRRRRDDVRLKYKTKQKQKKPRQKQRNYRRITTITRVFR